MLNVDFIFIKIKSIGRIILIFFLNCLFSFLIRISIVMFNKDKSSVFSRIDLMFLKIYV